ncbi:MAG: CBS domain-containing protein [Flavobacteriales bacterium]|nr:CBS domain-containing protein [Flavobacteriales bacterium]
MVKSFTGVRIVEEKQLPKQSLVKDFMTKQLITFNPDQTIDQVVNILIYKNISGGPVVDSSNNLVGIISEGDCLKQIIKGKYNNHPTLNGLVKDHMIKDVKTLQPNNTILEAAIAFLEQRVRRFPVLNNGKLIGQISQRDVMKAIEELNR